MTDTSKMLTGQVIFREVGDGTQGRFKMFFVGVVDVPDGIELKGEHQYIIWGFRPGDPSEQILHICQEGVIDRTEELRGTMASEMLTTPFWRT